MCENHFTNEYLFMSYLINLVSNKLILKIERSSIFPNGKLSIIFQSPRLVFSRTLHARDTLPHIFDLFLHVESLPYRLHYQYVSLTHGKAGETFCNCFYSVLRASSMLTIAKWSRRKRTAWDSRCMSKISERGNVSRGWDVYSYRRYRALWQRRNR